jgi:hypothetical protein
MAVQITNYGGLTAAIAAWLQRDGDTDIANRADDFIALCEQRMYYGSDEVPGVLPPMEAIRIPEMYQTNASFALVQSGPQPTGLLELVEAMLNLNASGPPAPLKIVEESILDSQSPFITGQPRMIALSGNNFRMWPDPGTSSFTAVLRYYAALATPSGTNATNWILTNAPGVYLNGCLLEAALFTGDLDSARSYGALYSAAAGALNTRAMTRRLAAGQNVRMTMRGWTP